jgi:hypothetical protein
MSLRKCSGYPNTVAAVGRLGLMRVDTVAYSGG